MLWSYLKKGFIRSVFESGCSGWLDVHETLPATPHISRPCCKLDHLPPIICVLSVTLSSVCSIVTQTGRKGVHQRQMGAAGDAGPVFFATNLSNTKLWTVPYAPCLSTGYVYLNMSHVIGMDCMRHEHNRETRALFIGSQSVIPLLMQMHRVAPWWGRRLRLLQPMLHFESGNLHPTFSMSKFKWPWSLTNCLGTPIKLNWKMVTPPS